MAEDLKIHKCWFHGNPYPHYDIPKKRVSEIASKCTVISSRDLVRKIKSS